MTQAVTIFVIPHDPQCILGLTAIKKRKLVAMCSFGLIFGPYFMILLPLHFVSKIMEIDLLKCANICISE